jgi:hypothetical protein
LKQESSAACWKAKVERVEAQVQVQVGSGSKPALAKFEDVENASWLQCFSYLLAAKGGAAGQPGSSKV